VAAPLDAVLQVALGDPADIAGHYADGPQYKVDSAHRDHHSGRHKYAREAELASRRQGVVGGYQQPYREAGDKRTAENQSLRKVKHDPVSGPEKQTLVSKQWLEITCPGR
jgi:hypothetical protein